MGKVAKAVSAFAAFALLILLPRAAAACSCAFGGGARPCGTYWGTPVIFSGQVTDISETTVTFGEGKSQEVRKQRLVRFAVEEALRGLSGKEAEVVTGYGGGDCGYGFVKGERYLVYASPVQKGGQLYTGICTPTKSLDKAAADLEYIHNLPNAPATATLYGTLWQTGRDIGAGKYLREPKSYVKIIIEGDKARRETFTDAEGKFQVSGLAAGHYKVKADLPDYLGGAEGQAELHASGCGDVLLAATWNGSLSGRVTDETDAPVKGLALNLVSADAGPVETLPFDKKELAFTNEDGLYEFKGLAPGGYLLVINPEGTPDFNEKPYPRTFYPGVGAREEAEVLKVEEGGKLENKDLRLTRRLAEREITGVVVWPDGRPAVAGTDVVLLDAERDWRQMAYPVKTDEQGRFTLKGYEGGSYLVTATVNLEGGKQMCGGPAEVKASGETAPVKLVITTPYGNCLAKLKPSSIKP
jgi:hypothetical protein